MINVFFRGLGKWITTISLNEINDETGQPIFSESSATQLHSVCGIFELGRSGEIEYRYNKSLEGVYCLYPTKTHPDKASPPEFDWREFWLVSDNRQIGSSVEDFSLSSFFSIDKSVPFVLNVIDKEIPFNIANETKRGITEKETDDTKAYEKYKNSLDDMVKKSGIDLKPLTVEAIFKQVKQTDTKLWNIAPETFKRDVWQKYSKENNLKSNRGGLKQNKYIGDEKSPFFCP